MRISTNYQYQLFQSSLNESMTNYVAAQQAVSTGKRITQISDDPYGTVSAISMTSVQSQLQQYASNLGTATDYMKTTDSALTQVGSLLNQAYSLAVQGANGTNDQPSRNALASQITDLQQQLVSIGNSQNSNGDYVFAGQNNKTQPFTITAGKLAFSGDTNNVSVEVGPNSQMNVNTPGSPLVTDIYKQLDQLKADLTSGSLSKISGSDIVNIKASISNVAQLNGEVGAQVAAANNLTASNTQQQSFLTQNISNVTDVNIAQAVVQLTQAQTAYQAAIESAGQANKYNLLSFIG